jgi:rRNA-processing protein FCF1
MRFVLDNSVVMRWLFVDGTQNALDYSARILELLVQEDNAAVVPFVWGLYDASYLELALREGLALATNDDALKKALVIAGGKLA